MALTGVATTIALDPLTVGLLDDNNVTVDADPARAPRRPRASASRSPSGDVRPDTLAGTIQHAGGHRAHQRAPARRRCATSSSTRGTGQLTADAGAGRLPLLNLDLSSGKRLDVGGTARARRTSRRRSPRARRTRSSEALNVSVLTPSLPIGFAVISATG